MGYVHTSYQPTDYEAQMVAAKLMALADLDPEYQDYLKSDGPKWPDGPMDYDAWLSERERWNALNARYETEVEPHWPDAMTDALYVLQDHLIREMTQIETALGY